MFITYRAWLYCTHRVYLTVPRVQVTEFAKKLQSEDAGRVLLVDVHSHGYYDSISQLSAGSRNSQRIDVQQSSTTRAQLLHG